MTYVLTERIRIGISACNYGAMVRWNRRGWDRTANLGREEGHFIWTPVCPEVMAGMGVRRMPVSLSGGNGDAVWSGKGKMTMRGSGNVTEQIRAGATACIEAVHRAGCEAFAFMEGSPSCGVYRTTLKNRRLGKPPGVFGSLLLKEELFLISALDLESPVKWWDWRRRLLAFVWLKRADITGKKELYDAWYHLKFICQEVDEPAARKIGRKLAAAPKRLTREFVDEWRHEVLLLLRRPSTIPRITAAMRKHYAHYRKHTAPGAETPPLPRDEMSRQKFVDSLHEMEKRAALDDFLFAGTPVVFGGR